MKIDKRFAWMRPGEDRSEKNSTKKKQLIKKWWKQPRFKLNEQ